jgi:hypothetical protein
MGRMYRIDKQISIAEFISPFGRLDPENRWVKIAGMIPWQELEPRYAEQFCEDNGAPGLPFRMAMGTLLLKQMKNHSDDEVLEDIIENPYHQFFIGLHEYTTKPPFTQRQITNFRKRMPQALIDEVNKILFKPRIENKTDPPDAPPPTDEELDDEKPEELPPNEGTLLFDATCAPANITYPTDVNLLNEAREITEEIIDTLHPYTNDERKPRTYRQEARKRYLTFIKNRNPRKNVINKAISQQLRYVKRNLGHIDNQLREVPLEVLSVRHQTRLETIRTLYGQQAAKHQTKAKSIPDRIVSIHQPWVRPIVRGKAKSSVEFGAKVSIQMINGYAFVDKTGWDAYAEEALLIPALKDYRRKYGFYPKAVIADRHYRNRRNLAFCKQWGIRLSGPRLGRPPKVTDPMVKQLERQDASARNAVEGKFGEGKTKYGLDRIMTRLQETSETTISMIFLCMNIKRRMRELLLFFWMLMVLDILLVDYSSKKVFAFKNVVCS